jgi:NAD(P)-dependent dehydrogenase (short-subunit alcohol dehydrogenase family)
MTEVSMSKTNRVVLVTGALTGIGRATALAFARARATLIVSGRRPGPGASFAKELGAEGAEAKFVLADVRDEADVARLIEETKKTFGRLDVAVNNAGVEGKPGPLTAATVETYEEVFDTNVKGVLLSMKHQIPFMLEQGSGSIVNVSSIFGHLGAPGAGLYTASKHAVEGLTRTAALEVAAAGIRVNAVAPGPIETDMLNRFTAGDAGAKAGLIGMMPAKRAGRVEEIAAAIVFLASPAASYLTGQVLSVDGGYSAQ